MFERYSEPARRALFFARYEASQLGCREIHPDLVLLGIIREGKGVAYRVLEKTIPSISTLREDITSKLSGGEPFGTSIEIPFTEATQRVLNNAVEEAERLGHPTIEQEHLLLAILREDAFADAETVRQAIVALRNRE